MAHRVVLVNPPALAGRTNERTYSGGIGVSRRLKPFERDALVLPPLDMLYAAAVAESAGARVCIVDLLLERLQGARAERCCVDRVQAVAVDAPEDCVWVGIRLSMPSLTQDLAFANRLKERLPEARVFVFGSVVMATLDHWVRDCRADLVLYGEPEALIGDILRAEDWRRVAGVVCPRTWVPLAGPSLFSGPQNEARYAAWVTVRDIGALPRPAWHLLDMPRYAPGGDTSRIGVYLQASRGCPIACTMCPYVLVEGKPWRSSGVEAVVDEIEYLNKTWGIYRVRFRDPNFGFNRKYARALCESIIRRGVRLEASVETSVEVFDEDGLRLMADAGIRTITTGVESNDAECLGSIGQKIAVNDRLRERIALCHRLGFHVYGTFCLGAPEESWDTVRKTWMFANELDIESGFTVMTPFPGTPMYWRALDEGLLPKRMRYSEWNSYTATMGTRHLTARDLELARLWARLETILPYRRRRVRGVASWLRHYLRHWPHYAVRQVCRVYVWVRRRRSPSGRAAAASPAAGADREQVSA